jgi:AraC-like DNA-binding protein
MCAEFSRHVGQPPIAYQAMIRARRATLLLRNFELTVGDVARQVGYVEPGYFAKMFRRKIGVSPSDYRASFLAKAASALRDR